MFVEKCPVCNGTGSVPGGFYIGKQAETTSITAGPFLEPCKACRGTGLIKLMESTDAEEVREDVKKIRKILNEIESRL